MVYKPAKLDLTTKQIQSMTKGKAVRLSHNQLGKGDKTILLHPENHIKLTKAYMSGKGCCLTIAPGEVMATQESQLEGSGFFDTLKAGFNKYVKPVLSTVGDVAANALSYTNPEMAPLIQGIRGGVRDLTGVGVARVNPATKKRISRKSNVLSGGSFLMPHQ